jgi:hypothetical protein
VAGELRNNGVTAASSHTTHDQDVKPWITPTPPAQAQALFDMANAALWSRQSAAFLPQQVPPKEAEQAELAAQLEMVETQMEEEEEEQAEQEEAAKAAPQQADKDEAEEEQAEQEEAAKAAPQQADKDEQADKEQAEQAEMEVSAGRAKQCSVSTSERLPTQRVRGVS